MASSFHPSLEQEQAMLANPYADIPSRAMRVKILYTFDDENRTNCLARVPDLANVPTVSLDEDQQIGLIELRHCIRAIVAASPELLARLTQGDFTIYAYDYSEYETPLVGQGMLSSLLAAMSPTPAAPAHQSKTMITGRVCKNVLGVFAGSCAETLEVKLRLVPVPRPAQHNYVKSMEAYRNLSPALSGGFDPNAWADFHSDGHVVDHLEQQSQNFAIHDSGRDSRLGHHDRRMSNASMNNSAHLSRQAASRPSSRASVRSDRPTWQRNDSTSTQQADAFGEEGPARKRAKIVQADWKGRSNFGGNAESLRVTASTAASVRLHKPVPRRPDIPGGNSLEPPPRVPTPLPLNQQALDRAKALQASFMRRESSLLQAQTPRSPYDNGSDAVMSSPEDSTGVQTVNNSPTDFPSSPPAMPDSMNMREPSSPTLPALPSLPRAVDSGYMSGSPFEDLQDQEARANDKKRGTGRKRGRPSMPAQKSDMSVVNFIDETPGPPELLPYTMNTAAMVANAALNDRRNSDATTRQLMRNSSFATVNGIVLTPSLPSAGGLDLQPAQSIEMGPTTLPRFAEISSMASTNPVPSLRLSTEGQEALDTTRAARPSINRNDAASPAPSEGTTRNKRSGGPTKRKKIIKDKLLESLANGQMPQYCFNCGSIETPTWRSLHIRTVDGAPEDNEADEPDADSTGIEILERDEATKKVTKYRVIRSAQRKKGVDPEVYQTIQVCNPCGLWFNKFRYMRPSEKWNRSKTAAKPSRKTEMQSDAMEPASDFPQSDFPHSDFPQSEMWNDSMLPGDTPMEDAAVDDTGTAENHENLRHGSGQNSKQGSSVTTNDDGRAKDQIVTGQGGIATNRPRANSATVVPSRVSGPHDQWSEAELDAALQRAIQSSPARFQGTQESPIEVEEDLTPRPTRRLLFPSPRRPGEVKSLDDHCLPSAITGVLPKQSKGSLLDKTHTPSKVYGMNDPFVGILTTDKENHGPHALADDDIARLFSPSIFKTPLKPLSANATMLTPPSKSMPTFDAFIASTPTPNRRVISNGSAPDHHGITRTPGGRTMDEFLPSFSSAERRELLGTPGRYIPGGSLATPSRRSGNNTDRTRAPSLEMTPFTRSWAQLLEENPGALDFGLGSGSDAFFHSNSLDGGNGHGAHGSGGGMGGPADMGLLLSPGSLGLLGPGSAGLGSEGLGFGSSPATRAAAMDWALLATPKKASPLAKAVVVKVERSGKEEGRS